MIYLDSSALMKLVRQEDETVALRQWLNARPEQPVVTSELGRIEVLRAARRVGARVSTEARAVVGDLDLVPLNRAVQDLACDIADPPLRTLDALHLASAVLLSEDLAAFVAYDHRLAAAAQAAGQPAGRADLPELRRPRRLHRAARDLVRDDEVQPDGRRPG